jgi:hypothetical protein
MTFFPLYKDITCAVVLTNNMIIVIPSVVALKIAAPLKEILLQKALIWIMKEKHTPEML